MEKQSRKPSSTHQLLLRLIFFSKSTAKIKLCYLINTHKEETHKFFCCFYFSLYIQNTGTDKAVQNMPFWFENRMLLYTPVYMMCVWAHVCMHMCTHVYIPLSICYRLGINYSTVQRNYESRTSADPHCQHNLFFSTKNDKHHHQHHSPTYQSNLHIKS